MIFNMVRKSRNCTHAVGQYVLGNLVINFLSLDIHHGQAFNRNLLPKPKETLLFPRRQINNI